MIWPILAKGGNSKVERIKINKKKKRQKVERKDSEGIKKDNSKLLYEPLYVIR